MAANKVIKPDILRVVSTGTAIMGRQRIDRKARAKLVVAKEFNAPTNSIEVDTLFGLTTKKPLETALINIEFADGKSWTGTFEDLHKALI